MICALLLKVCSTVQCIRLAKIAINTRMISSNWMVSCQIIGKVAFGRDL